MVNMIFSSEQEAERAKPIEPVTCFDEQILGRIYLPKSMDARVAQRVGSFEFPTSRTHPGYDCDRSDMNTSYNKKHLELQRLK